jgi:site-specific DNA-methyltransferase (adenine-specific)
MDAIEGLKQLDDGSVDLVFADPPYNIGIQYGGGLYKDNLSAEEYMDLSKDWWTECYRVLNATGSFYVMQYPYVISKWLSTLEDIGFIYRKTIAWVFSSNIGNSKRNFTTAHRDILFMTKSKEYTFNALADPQPYKNPNDKRIKKLIENGKTGTNCYDWWDIQLVKNISKEKTEWENQIPLSLVERVIKMSSCSGDLVLDPFMGSGTTAEAACKNGRNYIGFDINPKSKIITKIRTLKFN